MAASSFSQICQISSLASASQLEVEKGPRLHVNCPFASKGLYSQLGLTRTGNLVMTQVNPHMQSSNRTRLTCTAAVSAGRTSIVESVDFKRLQNGSDIRGVAVAGVEGEPVNLTASVSEAIGAAFAEWLIEKKKSDRSLRISVGHDSRISAEALQEAVSRGIIGAGLEVVLYGLASTPAMFNSTITDRADMYCPADGSIMITASHLPYNRNGFKFFTSNGGLGKADISDILARAAKIYSVITDSSWKDSSPVSQTSAKKANFMDQYALSLVEAVRMGAGGLEQPLAGFHIIVDAGNGAGGFFPKKVLEPLGASTTGSQFLEPDGMFPNHIPNPEDKHAMAALTRAVLEHNADLGIIFDTDVDRAAAVDSNGREFNRNGLIALLSAIILAEHPGTTIVTDSVTSDGLTSFIEKKLGGKHHRFKRGYKNVIDEAIRLNSIGQECHLAIETSGHGALKENHWLDDGAYLMVNLLIKLAAAKKAGEGVGSTVLTNLIKELEEAKIAIEVRFKIDQDHPDLGGGHFKEYGEKVLKHLETVAGMDPHLHKAPINYEGVRVSGYGGWFLLRLSLHDPVLPLNIEAPSPEAAAKIASTVLSIVKDFTALDTKPLVNYLKSAEGSAD